MSILDYYINDKHAHGIRMHMEQLFDEGNTDYKSLLNAARQKLELVIHHLSIMANVDIKEVSAKIEKLSSLGVIDYDVKPYFHLWWNLTCLGSHFQASQEQFVAWDKHIEICRHAIGICTSWYLHKYPPLELTDSERNLWLSDASKMFAVLSNDIQVCCKDKLLKQLNEKDIIVLSGKPWVGKTSLGNWITTEFSSKGYIPLVVHENTLVTFRALSSGGEPNNLRISSKSQFLHEIITRSILHGDSFVIFLDDPFGHRKFQMQNPLLHLRLKDWIDIARLPHSLGKVKIIITTPFEFLISARKSLGENANISPISRDNLSILDIENVFSIDKSLYNDEQLKRIVIHSAKWHGCTWALNDCFTDLVLDVLKNDNLGFDSLHVICRELKSSNEEDFLEKLINIKKSADIETVLTSLDLSVKHQLCAAYLSEALIEFYREYGFQTSLDFSDLCQTYVSNDESFPIILSAETSEWLISDSVSTLSLSNFPVFAHPEIRYAIINLIEKTMKPNLRLMILNLCGLSDKYSGKTLMEWESVHLLCRMAQFLENGDIKRDRNTIFIKAGGDPRNSLWAIIGNWSYIRGTIIENEALSFLKTIPHSFKKLIRPFIWESVANWTYIGESIRMLILKQTSLKEEFKPVFDDQSTLTFLAAGIVYYSSIQECAKSGCEMSEIYLDFMNSFISILFSNFKKSNYTSRNGDGLFSDPGCRFTGAEVLMKLHDLGLRSGSMDSNHPLIMQLRSVQEIKT